MKIFVVLSILILYVNQNNVNGDDQVTVVPNTAADNGGVANVESGNTAEGNSNQTGAENESGDTTDGNSSQTEAQTAATQTATSTSETQTVTLTSGTQTTTSTTGTQTTTSATGTQNNTNDVEGKITVQSCWASGTKIGSNSIQNGSGTKPTPTTRRPTAKPTTRRPVQRAGTGIGIF